ncbi:P-loop containing nucleoside triphosphate hydrolase protein [Testicularia cyperi]|uniref:P-loop containing nucleoside triphosphate hydrolase protein n=1 Tax=Testicularia cyperi TaxID=1882483 RepID=A0A317XHC0_9BASI|nr:P-loop containing nucleoside triphosphate hydrolase protein [Testicularia cyperi]DBA11466.1 TPA_inf: SMC6 [Testicularia cyperi]
MSIRQKRRASVGSDDSGEEDDDRGVGSSKTATQSPKRQRLKAEVQSPQRTRQRADANGTPINGSQTNGSQVNGSHRRRGDTSVSQNHGSDEEDRPVKAENHSNVDAGVDDEEEPVQTARPNGKSKRIDHNTAEEDGEGDEDASAAAEDEADELDSEADRIEEEQRLADANLESAQAGIIDSIELKNFMCHSHFNIEFGPRLNFVVGRNGSGKSAILTSLMIALGGKTSSTNRGSSLKDLVKKGASAATITIVVKNEGSDAFRPDIYGSRIIVERKILAEGGGSWKLRDSAGKTVSTARSELESFCDYANIQADNPIHILTQDTARQFLGSSDPSELYKFFLEGTQLSQLVREYELIDSHVRSMKTALALKSNSILQLEKLAQHALQQWQKVRETRGYQDKLDALDREFVWVQVHSARRELEAAVGKTEVIRHKLTGYDERLTNSEERQRECRVQIERLEQEAQHNNDESAPLTEQRAEHEAKLKTLTLTYKEFHAKEREMNEQIRVLNAQIGRYEDQIRDETDKLAGDRQAARQQLEEARQGLLRRRDELQEEEAEREEELREIDRKITDNAEREEVEALRQQQLRERYDAGDSRLRAMMESSKNRITAFGGPNVPALLRAIANETGWISKPLGPLGTHLKLRDMRWQRVVESVIGNTLNAFFVSNHSDRRRLKALMDRTNCNAMILSGKATLFDYSQGEPDASITTILRVLDCDNEIVKRQLILAAHIERAALVERRPDGDRLMRAEPRNVQHCFSADMFSITGGRAGSSSAVIQDARSPPRLSQNVQADIQRLQQELATLEPEIASCNTTLGELRRERTNLEREKQECRRALGNLRRQRDVNRTDIGRIDEEMQEAAPGNISALEEAKQETEEQKQAILDQFRDIQAQKTETKDQMRPINEVIRGLDERIKSFDERSRTLEDRMNAVVQENIKVQTNSVHYRTKRDACAAEISRHEEEETRLEQQYTDLAEQAREICEEEVESDRTLDEISAEKRELEQLKRRAASAAGVSLEQASADLQNRQRALKEAQEEVGTMNEAVRRLKHALVVRYAKWNFFRRSIATRAKSNFARNLAKRGYTGRLVFNHKTEKLSLHVQTEDKRQRSQATQTSSSNSKAMSGGERSFATACLLLSLWQAMSSPIRCLDEFDIFMDQVNRRVSLHMIINETKATPNVQYILITPQDMPHLGDDIEGVKILRIQPPARTEGALAD